MGGSGGSGGYPTSGSGSGSGVGGTSGGDDGAGADVDPCAIRITVNLFGPVPGVADQLSVGDVLDVRRAGGRAVGVFTRSGTRAGTIAGHAQLPTLLNCLYQGVIYAAEVIGASSGQIVLRVQQA